MASPAFFGAPTAPFGSPSPVGGTSQQPAVGTGSAEGAAAAAQAGRVLRNPFAATQDARQNGAHGAAGGQHASAAPRNPFADTADGGHQGATSPLVATSGSSPGKGAQTRARIARMRSMRPVQSPAAKARSKHAQPVPHAPVNMSFDGASTASAAEQQRQQQRQRAAAFDVAQACSSSGESTEEESVLPKAPPLFKPSVSAQAQSAQSAEFASFQAAFGDGSSGLRGTATRSSPVKQRGKNSYRAVRSPAKGPPKVCRAQSRLQPD